MLLEELRVGYEQFHHDIYVRALALVVPHLLVTPKGGEHKVRLSDFILTFQDFVVTGKRWEKSVVGVLSAHSLGDVKGGRTAGCHHTVLSGLSLIPPPALVETTEISILHPEEPSRYIDG